LFSYGFSFLKGDICLYKVYTFKSNLVI